MFDIVFDNNKVMGFFLLYLEIISSLHALSYNLDALFI